jgi:hypothetical protein
MNWLQYTVLWQSEEAHPSVPKDRKFPNIPVLLNYEVTQDQEFRTKFHFLDFPF